MCVEVRFGPRSEIFGRALRSPCVAETGIKRVYDEYMTYTDYCMGLPREEPSGWNHPFRRAQPLIIYHS
jgi:hypothetical protein